MPTPRSDRICRWIALAALAAGAMLVPRLVAADESTRVAIGQQIDNLRFHDIRYLSRSLDDLGESKAVVLVFTNTSCPLVQKYWPQLRRLSEKYAPAGVQFVSVNVGLDDELADVAQQGIDYELAFPLVKDFSGSLVRALGVERTPEVAVLDAQRRLVYRGRIDDQHRLGGSRPQPSDESLAAALDDLLAGREIAKSETPVDGCLITLPDPEPPAKPVTFYEHVASLLAQHCQECHHTGGPAPFSLVSLEEVSAQAEMIAETVEQRRMPPWYAHRDQKFANERGLSAAERELIAAWVKSGRPAGDAAQAPAPRTFDDSRWEIGEPDLVTTALETHSLPADGFVDYKYTVLPHVFWRDTWVSGVEILPSNPAVVHHANLAYWKIGESFDSGNFITGRVPGGTAMKLDDGIAFKIPAGSVIGLQIHYTTTGKPEQNRMSVGLRYPRSTVRQELRHLQATTSRFAIPPGASRHPVVASRTLPVAATGIGMFAHMHLRGRDMTFVAVAPDGRAERLLSIPNYHYDWQQNYRWEPGTKKFPAGTKIEVTAHYDNSAFNPFNPDASVTVRHGPQTVDEMMFGFFFYTADGEDLQLEVDPQTGFAVRK
jgi:thiol-disulfide isomerase/thioredoxin